MDVINSPSDTQAAEKLKQVFEFLKDFSTLQNPVIKRISEHPFSISLGEVPSHPFIVVPIRQGTSSSDDFVLRIRRPQITTPPAVSELLKEWVVQSQDPNKSPICREAINVVAEEETKTVIFEEDWERTLAWDEYLAAWEMWAKAEGPNRVADKFFQRIYGLHSALERETEAYELVLADGILECPEIGISHPIVSQRATLEFDPNLPEFIVRMSDTDSSLYTALLWELPDKNPDEVVKCKNELTEQGLSPADPNGLLPFLNRVKMVVSYGEFFDEKPVTSSRCYIYSSPILILRKRTGGFNEAIQRIIEAIPSLPELPPALVQICGIGNPHLEEDEEREGAGEFDSNYGNEREDILFTKAANREQVEIVDRLKRHGTVIVQGPPGTGKSYTIGNIIGHLLAQKKRILVTAHTTKALQVVRQQVVESLRPLCVAVLGDDAAAQSELEGAVSSILEHLNEDPVKLRREAATLTEQRKKLLREVKEARAKAFLARSNEYREVSVLGETMSPADAARVVAAGVEQDGWIPPQVQSTDALPLTITEILSLYRTNADLSVDEEAELSAKNPSITELPQPGRFSDLINWLAEAKSSDQTAGSEFWSRDLQGNDQEYLTPVAEFCSAAEATLCREPWRFTIVAECLASPELRSKWVSTSEAIRALEKEAHEFAQIAAEFGPEIEEAAGVSVEERGQWLKEIEAHLNEKGKLTSLNLLLKPKWKSTLTACRTNGTAPKTAVEVSAVSSLLAIRQTRHRLKLRWDRTMSSLGGTHTSDQLGDAPEQILVHYAAAIESLVVWKESIYEPLISTLTAAGFNWTAFLNSIPEEFAAHGQLSRLQKAICESLPAVVQARLQKLNQELAESEIDGATRRLRLVVESGGASRCAQALMQAVVDLDAAAFAEAHQALAELELKREVAATRTSLLEKLEAASPEWAFAIRKRTAVHGESAPPGDIREAWRWRRLRDELAQRETGIPTEIDKTIEALSTRLFEITGVIAAKLAWAGQLEALEGNQLARMALIGWQQTIQRLGKGTGKTAADRRQRAREEMKHAREAVPVWIMPLKKVLENFDPVTARFDAIIIDEASQCDVLGLVPLFMAKSIIVVGDHEQVSPEAVGTAQIDIDRIAHTHLQGIPQRHLYDGKASIYQFAQRAFSGTIMLREHFRCDSKIISFSNRLSYAGKIVPLRDTSHVTTKPAVVAHKVDGINVGKVNEIEALSIASLIAACLERPEYQFHPDGKHVSYGVISLLGTEQADRIAAILTEHLDLAVLEKHRVVCGNPAQFQGDERDVIFLSMVDSPVGGPLTMRQDDRFKKRFNVAASRARNQAWLVYSLDHQIDLQQGDIRRRIVEHHLDPDALEEKIQDAETVAESEFERRVIRRLIGEGYKVTPQWKVGRYRIDMVIEGDKNRLALELDGDKYHPIEKIGEDIERQAMLERAGWKFAPRIRGTQFFRDEERALKPLYDKLEQLNIRPVSTEPTLQPDNEAIVQIRERAAQILSEWMPAEDSTEVPVEEAEVDVRETSTAKG